jgi:hypothetical protein
MNKLTKSLLLIAPVIVSCGPPSPTDDTASSVGESTIQDDCESFCQRAIECDSKEYAADWEFKSVQGCVDDCMTFTNWKSDPFYIAECVDITRAMWVCAGMIETCDDFEWYEAAAFGKTGFLGNPCSDELINFSDNCN